MRDIKTKRASEWKKLNPVLRIGEPGFDRTSGRMKIGDGRTAWNELSFVVDSSQFVPATDLVSGSRLAVYGHSYATVPGYYVESGEDWPTVLTQDLAMSKSVHGISGARMIEIASAAVGAITPATGTNLSFTPGSSHAVVL